MVSSSPADIIWTEPKSIREIPTARKVIIKRTGLRMLDLIDSPRVVGNQEVRRRRVFDPTRI